MRWFAQGKLSTMQLDRISKGLMALFIISFVICGGLSAPVFNGADGDIAKLELLFDPGDFNRYVSTADVYGQKPLPPPPPPPLDDEDPYFVAADYDLEDEYY